MDKNEYLFKLQNENKKHVSNIALLIRTLDFKIEGLKQSKKKTDRICERFDIIPYKYNLVYELEETKEKFIKDLRELMARIEEMVARKSRNVDYDIQRVSSINDLLDTYEVQLNAINKNDLKNIDSLQLNAIKKEIYEKYMRIRSEIDKSILKEKFDKMQRRNAVLKAFDNFFVLTEMRGKQRENLFIAIQGIDDCNAKFVEGSEPNREYKIIDILADIDVYLNESKKSRKYKEQYNKLYELREKIGETFSIDKAELKAAINEKYKSRLPMPVEKNIDKMIKKHQKSMEFLYKSGYVKTYEQIQYRSKMAILIDKIKLLSEKVKKENSR